TSPGVSVQRSGGPGQAAFVSLRGASPDQTLVLLDGIPLQGPGGDAIDLSTLPSSFVSKVVVSRGVLGAQLGAGALGGAVELVPKTTGASEPQFGAELAAGSFGSVRVTADAVVSLASAARSSGGTARSDERQVPVRAPVHAGDPGRPLLPCRAGERRCDARLAAGA